jgi:hypothetical protein
LHSTTKDVFLYWNNYWIKSGSTTFSTEQLHFSLTLLISHLSASPFQCQGFIDLISSPERWMEDYWFLYEIFCALGNCM